jgi:chemotaxis protein methyltransferase CheR
MPLSNAPSVRDAAPELTPEDFRRVRRIAYERAGLAIPDGKEGLIRSRVCKRLREHQVTSFSAYFDVVEHQASGDEMVTLIDLLTTNKTDFFREAAHFDVLLREIVPSVVRAGTPLRIWSAGCSSGEEAYTLAMVLRETLPPRYDCRILATDISTRVLAAARRGTYSVQQLSGVSAARRQRWFTPLPDGGAAALPELRTVISFAQLNLMEPWPMSGPFDVIFCRNVMIYFDKPTVARLVQRFHALLAPRGHLFLGHSESLTAIDHAYRYVQPAVYAK